MPSTSQCLPLTTIRLGSSPMWDAMISQSPVYFPPLYNMFQTHIILQGYTSTHAMRCAFKRVYAVHIFRLQDGWTNTKCNLFKNDRSKHCADFAEGPFRFHLFCMGFVSHMLEIWGVQVINRLLTCKHLIKHDMLLRS